jgi:hypothetical protein
MMEEKSPTADLAQIVAFKETKIAHRCVGNIVEVDPATKIVRVDFEGNPYKRPLQAMLGRPFMLEDLTKALDYVLDVRLDFEDRNAAKPIITDIYYSIMNDHRPEEAFVDRDIVIKGRRIILEGNDKIVIKSGGAVTVYDAKSDGCVTKAKNVSSTATQTNRIRGGNINLN